MTKARVGHSTYDAIAQVLAGHADADDRLKFLRAAIEHSDHQLTAANEQLSQVSDKWSQVRAQWEGKVTEAESIKERAEAELAFLRSELDALEGDR